MSEENKTKQEDEMWNRIEKTMRESKRITREDLIKGEIVQLCHSLKFLASIYEPKTAKVLVQAHDLICAMVNASCLIKIFECEKLNDRYVYMKTLERQLAKRATRCTNREKKIQKKLEKLEGAK